MSSREFSEWRVFYRLDPWDQARGDFRAAIIASAVHNAAFVAGNYKPQPSQLATIEDYLPQWMPDDPTEQEATLAAKAIAMAEVHGLGVIEDDA